MQILLVSVLLLAGVAIVLRPLLRRDAGAPDPTTTPAGDAATDRALAADVARYRKALRAGTVCARCREANPPGSRFCADCGRALAGASNAAAPGAPAPTDSETHRPASV